MIREILPTLFRADFLFSILRITAPILFVTLAVLIAQKAAL